MGHNYRSQIWGQASDPFLELVLCWCECCYMGHTYRWPFSYTNSITDESVTVAHFCSMNICGMVWFGGLLSEKLPCLFVCW